MIAPVGTLPAIAPPVRIDLRGWIGRRKSRRYSQAPKGEREDLLTAEIATLSAGYRHTRQQKRRATFNREFAEITERYGGEPRKIRRAIARDKAKRR